MSRRLPISGSRPPSEPEDDRTLSDDLWSRGRTFLELVDAVAEAPESLDATFAAVQLVPSLAAFYARFPRRARILALADLSESESLILVAQAERLWSLGEKLWMRTVAVAAHPDLAQRFAASQWPLFVFFADDRKEFARWGPRPAALQEREFPGEDLDQAHARRLAFHRSNRGNALAQDLARILAPYGSLPVP